MSSAEDEYKREGRLMQLSPQEQMKYVDATINKMKYVGDLNRIDILNLLREAVKGKDVKILMNILRTRIKHIRHF